MWKLGIVIGSVVLAPLPALAQEKPHVTMRQVEAVYERGEKHPPLTKDGSPAFDGRIVVYEDEDGTVYELQPAIATAFQVEEAEAVLGPQTDSWLVVFQLEGPATARLANLTAQLACLRDRGDIVRSQIAIVVDGEVSSVAGMAEPSGSVAGVECGEGITTGEVSLDIGSRAEARKLALALGAFDPRAQPSPTPEPKIADGPKEDGAGVPVVPIVLIGAVAVAIGWVAIRRGRTTPS